MHARRAGHPTPLALTMGDPSGIGPEIAMEAWRVRETSAVPPFALYADSKLIAATAKSLTSKIPVRVVPDAAAAANVFAKALPIVEIPLAIPAVPGTPDVKNAAATIQSIKRAVGDVAAGRAGAVVTNPIAKAVLYQAGFVHAGHTEYLGELAEEHWPVTSVEPVMMLASSELRVVPVTIHVALKNVPGLLTTEKIISVTRITAAALKRDFGIGSPRLVLTGLNPHAGENGARGVEDRDIVKPAVDALRANGLNVTGPHSADTLFHAAARETYDAAIAMYHDQALIPIKTLSFDEGVNVTLGLPFVRTSPDHGTAFGIAGKGRASAASLIAALQLAAQMVERRQLAGAL